ncbi:hypothetical protein U9M48_003368 [Paspalum notatum var. saurae]|uniref:Uncharacterized protein n=1 Tax=Paspalum notatum var. saurae TaxID=547442 RepID=A0AAQ3SI53_PASNO
MHSAVGLIAMCLKSDPRQDLIIEPTLRGQVIAAQKRDKGVAHIREGIDEEKKVVSRLMTKASYGSRVA